MAQQSGTMPSYELLYVIPAQYTDAELPAVQKKVAAALEKAGAKVSRHDHAGKLKLAYPIRHQRYGHYLLAEFSAEPQAISAITNELRLTSEVIRSEISRVDERLRAHAPRTLVSHEEAGLRAREAATEKAPAAPAPAPAKPSLTSEQIEQKIEEILKEPVV